jgi:exodeoxyribonuclease-3
MKIVSWNINSVRLRLPLVLKFLQEEQPDVLCLQETKCPDEHFPHDAFKDAGYAYIHIQGMKSYNGQAIISKLPFENPQIHNRVGREDCRHVSVTYAPAHGGFDLHNLYIPAGGDEPDVKINDKFAHKLGFVDEMTAFFADTYSPNDKVVAVGDFNIAPMEHDVWSHKQLLKVVSHTPIEVEKCNAMQASINFIDVARHFIPEEEKAYSWWSYRSKDWKASNRGRRLDHIWMTSPFRDLLAAYETLSDYRDAEKPSDHAPIVVQLKS